MSSWPASVEDRSETGHWEIDTVMGTGSRDCIVTLVERKPGYTLIADSLNHRPRKRLASTSPNECFDES